MGRGVGEVEEDVLCAADIVVVKEDRGGSVLDGFHGAVFAASGAGTHKGGAAVFHDGVDIAEVDVDLAAAGDDFGNAFGCGEEDVVGFAEGLVEVHVAKSAQVVVVDYQDGVDILLQCFDTDLGLLHTDGAFKFEGFGDDGDNEYFGHQFVVEVDAFCYFCHYRGGTCSRTAAHTSCNEEHLSVVGNGLEDFVFVLKSHFACMFRDVAGTEFTEGYLVGHGARLEGFGIGVADDEFYTVDSLLEHVVDCVSTTAADTYYFYFGGLLTDWFKLYRACSAHEVVAVVGFVVVRNR